MNIIGYDKKNDEKVEILSYLNGDNTRYVCKRFDGGCIAIAVEDVEIIEE